ncbi:MAG TPA: methionyl-tRNA formyltransferase [Spirochaetales bacterium]|nr:methionyl-tRNA formyltransferase [Spirochaetales bacterium]HRY56463.1 methionyl-tRNA formyltransferase [Spirochaetia bacterium]HRZ65518.1 methionyl-tRNA formyltransferase [Spirochaetia bacterium]
MRLLFAGSPDIAVPSLVRLSFEHEIVGVLTNPEAPCGRGQACAETPVAQAAAAVLGPKVPVLTPERLGAEARAAVAPLGAEILVSFAYGRIFGPRFLELFPRGGVNVHPSLLPRYRGPAPIQSAILARDSETGITVQRLALEMDSGDILGVERLPLSGLETAEDLSEVAALLGADLLSRVLGQIEEGKELARPQEGEASYCSILKKEDGLIDWGSGVLDIDAKVRAFSPWPGAFTYLRGQRLAVLESFPYPHVTYAAGPGSLDFEEALPGTVLGLDKSRGIMVQTKDGLVALRRLQLQHKKALPYREFANGIRELAGTLLGYPGPAREETDRP